MTTAIFPASGGLGTATLTRLVSILPPKDITLISRYPDRHSQYAAMGITTRRADFDDEQSFKGVFKGVKSLNIISYPTFEDLHRFQVAKVAIDNAISQGVTHIFYSSLAFAGQGDSSVAHVMAAHLRTESYLHKLSTTSPSFTYTIIRQGIYSSSYPIYTGAFNITNPGDGIIRIPHDGSGPGLAFVKREELGEATANVIASYHNDPESFPYINKRIILTGSRVWTLSEAAGSFTEILGREVRVEKVSVDEYAGLGKVKASFPEVMEGGEDWPRLWADAWEGIRQGETSVVTGEMRRWLGREPEGFEETIRGIVGK